jgi:hypothetical protein
VWSIVEPIFRALATIVELIATILAAIYRDILVVVGWLATIVLSALVVFLTALVLAIIGNLVVSQVLAGWYAAHSRKQVILAGFAIGSAFSLITLVSIGTPAVSDSLNQAWSNAWELGGLHSAQSISQFVTTAFTVTLPTTVRDFVFLYLTNLQAPALDSFILLVVMVLASLSILFRTLSGNAEIDEVVPVTFLARQYVLLLFGIFLSILLSFAQAETGDASA